MRNSFEVLYHFYTIQYILGLLSLCFFTEVTQNVWFTEIHDDWSDMAERAWVTTSFHDWMFWPSRSNGSEESRRAQGKGGQWYIQEATISWPAKCKESFYVYHTLDVGMNLCLPNIAKLGNKWHVEVAHIWNNVWVNSSQPRAEKMKILLPWPHFWKRIFFTRSDPSQHLAGLLDGLSLRYSTGNKP